MKKSMVLTTLLVFCLALPTMAGNILFHTALESAESVIAGGGEVLGGTGYFAPGVIGNGYVAPNNGDVVRFPVEGRINPEHGTCEFFVKTVIPYSEVLPRANEVFLMTCANGENRFFVQSHFASGGPGISWRVNSANTWLPDLTVNEYDGEAVTDWEGDEIHHIAGMFGENGSRLYLDGILAGKTDTPSSFVGGLPELWAIANEEGGSLPSGWLVDEFTIWDDYLTDEEVMKIATQGTSVEPSGKLVTTWARLKGQ